MTKIRPCAYSWCGSPMWTEKKKNRTCPRGKINLRFQGGCSGYLQPPCAAHQCISPKQGSGLLQNANESCRPDRCPASLDLDASSERALTILCCGKATLC